MTSRHFILATAGHVDHGKSALVEALTGTHPSRLPEEKARGITIDLGFAHGTLPHPLDPNVVLDLGVIDVPGHEDFVKNMVSGLGAIDVALLVVAADDGWMPQSEEHWQILEYLQVSRVVVALTKADLTHDISAATADVRAKLQGSWIEHVPVVPVSTMTGAGLLELRAALAAVLAETNSARDVGKPRLWVDRALSLRGVGTVVTGTLQGGNLQVGDMVVLEPGAAPGKVRGLQSHHQSASRVGPGRRVAVQVPEWSVADRRAALDPPGAARRGTLVTVPGLALSSATWDVMLTRSARLVAPGKLREAAGKFAVQTQRPLKDGAVVNVHQGSGVTAARLALLEARSLGLGEAGLAQLRFAVPVPGFPGDRFILRDASHQTTLAGGRVLFVGGPRRGARQEPHRQLLAQRAQAGDDIMQWVLSELRWRGCAPLEGTLRHSPFAAESVGAAWESWQGKGQLKLVEGWAVDAALWREWGAQISAAVDAAHQEHPEWLGAGLSQLRSSLQPTVPRTELFDGLVAELASQGFILSRQQLRRAGHRPRLPERWQAAGARLQKLLSEQPLEPPPRRELEEGPDAASALAFLVDAGQVVEVADDLFFLPENLTRATLLVKNHLRRHGQGTVSQLREMLGTSRRVVVPLLEYLDRQGVTMREGDVRRLKPRRSIDL